MDFIDRKEFRGPVQEQIEQAHQFVLRHTNKSAIIEGLYRQDVYELPVSSIREIITNAVLHRSYVDPASIQVSIYDDRVEIDSPGMLCAGLSVADALSGKSKCRNKALAEAFQYMNLIEGWGTGLPRLYKACAEMGLPEPKFSEFGDGIKVTIYKAIDANHEANPSNTGLETDSKAGEKTDTSRKTVTETSTEAPSNIETGTETNTEQKVIALIKHNPSITIKEMALQCGMSVSGIRYVIDALRKRGKLSREGAQKRGKWIVVDSGD